MMHAKLLDSYAENCETVRRLKQLTEIRDEIQSEQEALQQKKYAEQIAGLQSIIEEQRKAIQKISQASLKLLRSGLPAVSPEPLSTLEQTPTPANSPDLPPDKKCKTDTPETKKTNKLKKSKAAKRAKHAPKPAIKKKESKPDAPRWR